MNKTKKMLIHSMTALQNIRDPKSLRPKLIEGWRAGQEERFRKMKSGGKVLTEDDLRRELNEFNTEEGKALLQTAKLSDITKEDMVDIVKAAYDKVSKETGNEITQEVEKVGRDEPCPCGSGLKYKRCCLYNKVSKENHE
jgi:uncharacterized protein YecA (UPF0149 family)